MMIIKRKENDNTNISKDFNDIKSSPLQFQTIIIIRIIIITTPYDIITVAFIDIRKFHVELHKGISGLAKDDIKILKYFYATRNTHL